ncbi:trypsin-like peptidase domain-containing protein [Oceanicola sp. S124]|uniref:trypsin-like peptidase domain-containing protein n=1 Tax=Oceanicola sp. S124 TaxID=1042378 RepID=UPI0002557EB9|nr:trypsin-like peptidase domain-containing protein [Oceanicola sp. S124]
MTTPTAAWHRRLPAALLALLLTLPRALPAQDAPQNGPEALAWRLGEARDAALERAMQSTVRLTDLETREIFLGSGFVYGAPALVVTNAHVAGDHPWLAAHFGSEGDEWVMHLRRRAIDPARDLALYDMTEPFDLPPLQAAAAPPRLGDPLFALGAPLGLAQSLSGGHLSHVARQVDPAVPLAYYQHDAATNPGSSGGPLVNAAGEVVGVNARIADGSRLFNGVAYAIPITQVDRMIADRLPPVPVLGLSLRPLPLRIHHLLEPRLPARVLVEHVTPDSPAARAGIAAGDMLLRAEGRELHRPGDLAFALEARGGPHVTLTLYRPGSTPEGAFPKARDVVLRLDGGTAPRAAPAEAAPLQLGLTLGPDGHEITGVAPDSAAFAAGLATGDRIEAVNGVPGPLATDALEAPVLLRLRREGRSLHLLLDPAARPSLKRPVTGNALDPAVIPF